MFSPRSPNGSLSVLGRKNSNNFLSMIVGWAPPTSPKRWAVPTLPESRCAGGEFRRGAARCRRRGLGAFFLFLAAFFGEAHRFADALAEVIELGAAVFAAATYE